MRRWLALVGETFAERALELPWRVAVVAVIALGLAGQQSMEGMMIVVVPLRAKLAPRRVIERIEQARLIVVVFQDQMDVPPGLGGKASGGDAQFAQQGGPRRLGDGVDGVETEAVEAIVVKPGDRIFDREAAHLRHLIVDGVAPWCVGRREELRRIAGKVVSFRAEV